MISVWESYGIGSDAHLSFNVVGSRKMASLHKQYLHKEGATDVLAFSQQDLEAEGVGFVTPEEEPLELGDIVICYPLVRDQASRYGVMVDEQVEKLAIHGMKNLMGNHGS